MGKAFTFDKHIIIWKTDPETGTERVTWNLHACVNKRGGYTPEAQAGGVYSPSMGFRVRWFPAIVDMCRNLELYTLEYNGVRYDLEDYDDYMEYHQTVMLTGRGVYSNG